MTFKLPRVQGFHEVFAYVSIVVAGVVGLWGLAIGRAGTVPSVFRWATWVAAGALLVQVVAGVYLMSDAGIDPGNQHVFYGVVIATTFAFAYIYRAQFRKRPALYYGLLLLFTMGLGIRGIMTFGQSF